MPGIASALPFSLGILIDSLGATGPTGTGATTVNAGAAAGAGLRFSGNLVALGSGIPDSFHLKGHFQGIIPVLGIPGFPNVYT